MQEHVERIPSMKEVAELRGTNGYKMVSTFSGCGGSCLGFEMAGFDIRYASEFVPAARENYEQNHPGVFVDGRDIREVSSEDILTKTGLKVGELDLLEGSPPCAAFSTLGSREDGWGEVRKYSDTTQRVDDLFFEYVRLVKELQPKVFVAENVAGLAKGTAIGYLRNIQTQLGQAGYKVESRILDASWLGIGQSRNRLFIMGVRNDLAETYGLAPAFPTRKNKRTSIRDVLDIDSNDSMIDPDTGDNLRAKGVGLVELLKLNPGERSEKYFQVTRPHPDKPAPTILTGDNHSYHPRFNRKWTQAELRTLCSFPADFILHDKRRVWHERLGRSVPPLMARAVAIAICDNILNKLPAEK